MQSMAEMATTLKDIDYVLKLQEVAVSLIVVVVVMAAVAVVVEDQLGDPIIVSLFQGYQKLAVGRI